MITGCARNGNQTVRSTRYGLPAGAREGDRGVAASPLRVEVKRQRLGRPRLASQPDLFELLMDKFG